MEGAERCLTNLRLFWHLSQLAAGSEHVIAGKTVRVNAAGPRPELPLLYLQQGRLQQPMGPPPPAAGESPLTSPLCAPAVVCSATKAWKPRLLACSTGSFFALCKKA